MESNFLTAVFLPLALFIIMMSMGMGLTLDDFKRVTVEPKLVILGVVQTRVTLFGKQPNLVEHMFETIAQQQGDERY